MASYSDGNSTGQSVIEVLILMLFLIGATIPALKLVVHHYRDAISEVSLTKEAK